MSLNLPSLPPLPSSLRSGAATIKEQIVERTAKKAYREEVLRIYRCECQRCGHVWRTREFVLPKACSSCHQSYWDRTVQWKRKTKAERDREKLQKKLDKKNKQLEFNRKLKEQLDAILEEAKANGEDVSKLEKKAAKFLVDALKADVKRGSGKVAVLGAVDTVAHTEVSDGIPDILEEILPEDAQGSNGILVPMRDTLADFEGVENGLSADDGFGEGDTN